MGWWIRKIEKSLLSGLLFALIVEISVVVMRTEFGLKDNDILAPSGVLLIAAIFITIGYKSRQRFKQIKCNRLVKRKER